MLLTAGRIILTAVVATVSAGGTAWWVTDFITDKYATGFTSSIDTLNLRLADLSEQLRAEASARSSERESLARDIAERINRSQQQQNRDVDSVSDGLLALTNQLRDTTGALDQLGASVDSLRDRLANSEARQVEFERYVVSVLLQQEPPVRKSAAEIQDNWNIGSNVVEFTNASSGQPAAALEGWLKYSTER